MIKNQPASFRALFIKYPTDYLFDRKKGSQREQKERTERIADG